MKSSKWIMGLMVVVLLMALAPSSFAQIQLQIYNTPSAGEVLTNRNAQTSDPTSVGSGILVSGQLIANSPLTTTTLTLTFAGPITSSAIACDGTASGGCGVTAGGIPALDPIQIQGQSGLFASITAVASVSWSKGTITINLPGFGTTPNSQSGTFRVLGVRIDANGLTAPLTVAASISSSANNYISPTTPTATIVSSLGAGIGSFTQSAPSGGTNNGTFLIFTNQTGTNYAHGTATLTLTEGFASAWRTPTDSTVTGVATGNGTQMRLTVNGIPSGVTVAVTTDSSAKSAKYPTVSLSSSSLTAATSSNPNNNVTYVTFSKESLTTSETIVLQLSLTGTPSSLTAGSITATVTMYPIGTGNDTTVSPAQPDSTSFTAGYPQFQEADLGPVTIGTITAATTSLLIPYGVTVGSYDTGIALANTTADPFGGSATGGATPASGTITFTLYPRLPTGGAGTPISVTSSSTKIFGAGLSSDGTLAAGATFTGLVGGDILPAAGASASAGFFGYIFIQTNFIDAHGAAYIFNGAGFTSSTPVLVVPNTQAVSRNIGGENLNN